jgi:hypothetical protein
MPFPIGMIAVYVALVVWLVLLVPGARHRRRGSIIASQRGLRCLLRASQAPGGARHSRRNTFAYPQINDLEVLFLMSVLACRFLRREDGV